MSGIYFSICGFIFIIIFIINFFSKRNTNNTETKLYKSMLIATFIGTGIDIFSYILYKIGWNINNLFYTLLSKMMLIYFIFWILTFIKYVYLISKKSILKIKPLIFKILFILFSMIILCTSITFKETANAIIPTGLGVNMTYFIVAIGIVFIIVLTIENYKNIVVKKYTPIFLIIILLIISFIIQRIFPDLFLINFCLTIIVCVMYFTIENPDMKMLEEVNKAKKISDNANQEKSMFLFNITKEIRNISRNIDDHADNILSEVSKEETNIENIGDNAREIKYDISKFNTMTNDILDVSNIDASNIKIYNTKFNIKLIIKGLVSIYKEKCQEKGLEFRTDIASDIPEYLYGDSINLKKVMITLLDNAIKYTNNGYVELNVNFVKKIDICRLIISIEDSGIGIKPEELDTIFYKKKEELNRNNLKNNLYTAKKIITMMEGTIIANSDYNKGTTMKIVLDAKIVPTKENVYIKEYDNKKILLVDDSETCEKIIKKLLRGSNINIERTEYGKYCLDKIRSKEKYDLILIKDELKPLDGYTIMTKLQEIRNFNIPCILLTKNTKVEYDDSYQKYGFKDYIIKSNDKNKILNTLDKYLK